MARLLLLVVLMAAVVAGCSDLDPELITADDVGKCLQAVELSDGSYGTAWRDCGAASSSAAATPVPSSHGIRVEDLSNTPGSITADDENAVLVTDGQTFVFRHGWDSTLAVEALQEITHDLHLATQRDWGIAGNAGLVSAAGVLAPAGHTNWRGVLRHGTDFNTHDYRYTLARLPHGESTAAYRTVWRNEDGDVVLTSGGSGWGSPLTGSDATWDYYATTILGQRAGSIGSEVRSIEIQHDDDYEAVVFYGEIQPGGVECSELSLNVRADLHSHEGELTTSSAGTPAHTHTISGIAVVPECSS